MNKVIIAVDAGGTKTKACAFTYEETIVYQATGESGSPAVVGEEQAFRNVFGLVQDVYQHVKIEYLVTFVQVGLSGLGVIKNIKELEDRLSRTIDNVEVSIVSDAVIGIYSIVENKYTEGVLVLSGTGSLVYGINHENALSIGGFGHLLTETGSSFYVVKQLICETITYFEEHQIYPELSKNFMKKIGAEDLNGFKVFMYHKNKTEVASYSQFIDEQARKGDADAIRILRKAGSDLAHSVSLLYKHLHLSENTVLGFRGSFIQKASFVKEEILERLNQETIYPIIVKGQEDPIYGAYYMAIRKGKLC